jgi:hypothetical protein
MASHGNGRLVRAMDGAQNHNLEVEQQDNHLDMLHAVCTGAVRCCDIHRQ